MQNSDERSDLGNGVKKCRFPEAGTVRNGSIGNEEVVSDIDRLTQEILTLGANYNISRHRSLSGSDYEVRRDSSPRFEESRSRSTSRGDLEPPLRKTSRSSGTRVDFENLTGIPRSASFSGQEQDLDTFYEGMNVPGWIDKRPLSCRYYCKVTR